jgi:hypothetical protein
MPHHGAPIQPGGMPHPGPQYGPQAGGAIQTFAKGAGAATTTPASPTVAAACAAAWAAASSCAFLCAASIP